MQFIACYNCDAFVRKSTTKCQLGSQNVSKNQNKDKQHAIPAKAVHSFGFSFC